VGDIEIIDEGENQFFLKDNSTIKFLVENYKVTGMVSDAMRPGIVIVKEQKVN
jgi:hypothetical protein